jgi:hypothetical protein
MRISPQRHEEHEGKRHLMFRIRCDGNRDNSKQISRGQTIVLDFRKRWSNLRASYLCVLCVFVVK